MSGHERLSSQNQESELKEAVLVNVESLVPGLGDREVFIAQLPEGIVYEDEKALYFLSGGQVRRFGETVDLKMVPFEQWLRMKGAITYPAPSEEASAA